MLGAGAFCFCIAAGRGYNGARDERVRRSQLPVARSTWSNVAQDGSALMVATCDSAAGLVFPEEMCECAIASDSALDISWRIVSFGKVK